MADTASSSSKLSTLVGVLNAISSAISVGVVAMTVVFVREGGWALLGFIPFGGAALLLQGSLLAVTLSVWPFHWKGAVGGGSRAKIAIICPAMSLSVIAVGFLIGNWHAC